MLHYSADDINVNHQRITRLKIFNQLLTSSSSSVCLQNLTQMRKTYLNKYHYHYVLCSTDAQQSVYLQLNLWIRDGTFSNKGSDILSSTQNLFLPILTTFHPIILIKCTIDPTKPLNIFGFWFDVFDNTSLFKCWCYNSIQSQPPCGFSHGLIEFLIRWLQILSITYAIC